MSLHRALVQYDRLFAEAESIRIERDKLRAEIAELKMPISPDELLPMALMNARLIEENDSLRAENAELRKLVKEAWKNGWAGCYWPDFYAQYPILKDN